VRGWLFTAYQKTLDRPPDDAGYQTWLQILGSGSGGRLSKRNT
jgi:hypothetical protein